MHWRWFNNFSIHCTLTIFWSNLSSKVGHCLCKVLSRIYLTKEVNKIPFLWLLSDDNLIVPFQYSKYLGLDKDIFWNVYFGGEGNNMIFHSTDSASKNLGPSCKRESCRDELNCWSDDSLRPRWFLFLPISFLKRAAADIIWIVCLKRKRADSLHYA